MGPPLGLGHRITVDNGELWWKCMPTNDTKTDDSKGPVVVWFESLYLYVSAFLWKFIQWGWLKKGDIGLKKSQYSQNLRALCWLKKKITVGVVGQPDNLWSCSRRKTKVQVHLLLSRSTIWWPIWWRTRVTSWRVPRQGNHHGKWLAGMLFFGHLLWEAALRVLIRCDMHGRFYGRYLNCITHINVSYLLNHI